MKRLNRALLLLTVLSSLHASAAEPPAAALKVTFDELPDLVLKRNRHVSGSRALLESAERRTGHLARSYLPSVEAFAGAETFETGPFSQTTHPYGAVEARWNLFRGGRDLLEERAREAQVQASRASLDQAVLEELTKARQSYWELVYWRELRDLLGDALKQNAENLRAAERRIGAGLATESDRLDFEMYRIQVEQDLARAELAASSSQRALGVLLGHGEDTRIETVARIPHQHDDELLVREFDPGKHREVRSLAANGGVAGNRSAQARRWWAPSVDVYAAYSLYTLREREYLPITDRDEAVAGVRLTFQLFDGLQSRSEAQALQAEAHGMEDLAAQTSLELSARFRAARQQLKITHDLVHSAEESVKLGRSYLKRTRSEYARGVKNSPDMLSAVGKYVELQRRYAEIRRDYQLARIELLSILAL